MSLLGLKEASLKVSVTHKQEHSKVQYFVKHLVQAQGHFVRLMSLNSLFANDWIQLLFQLKKKKKRSFQNIIQVFQEFPNINMIFSSWVLVIKNQLPQHWLSAHARLYADNDDTVQLTQWKLPYGAERKPKNKDV